MTKQCQTLYLGLFLVILSGCASVGPVSVPRDRIDYNASIAESWKQQVLLNIVKMRYAEPVSFVDVGQIVAGYTLETGVNVGGSTAAYANAASFINAGISGKYTDRPTITYVPLTGNAFIKSLLTPLSPENLMFAVQSGVPADMLLKLGVASVNGLRNRSVPIAGFRPADQKFLRAVEILRNLQISGAIRIKSFRDKDGGEFSAISFWSRGAPPEIALQVSELCELLGLDPGAAYYKVVFDITPENNHEIALQSVPLMHLLSFLAAHVEVPEKDMSEGRASPGARQAKEHLDNQDQFVVKCSDSRPQDAFVSVEYRNHWFWIDDRNIESKRVISFILLVFTLADPGRHGSLPQVTIPAQ